MNDAQGPLLPDVTFGLNLRPGTDDDGWEPPAPVRLPDGTRLVLLKDGQALDAAFHVIRRARKRVCVELYILRNDATGKALVELLCATAQRGVRVYVICDSLGSHHPGRTLFDRLRSAGVRFAEFHPIRPWECRFSWRPGLRDHRKMLVVDDHIAGTGGLNVGDEYAGRWISPEARTHWLMRDTGVGVIGPGARVFFQSFARTWRYIHSGGRITTAAYTQGLSIEPPAKGARLGKQRRIRAETPPIPIVDSFGFLASVPTLNSPLRRLLFALLRNARESIRIIMAYFAPDEEFIRELCKASRRGVRVELIFARESDWGIMVTAARSFYQTLMDAGIIIHERLGAVLHAKSMVIDARLVLMGSTNLDYRSIEYNCELTVMVDDHRFASQVENLMDHDIRHAQRIDPQTWRERPVFDRLVQWAVSRLRYVL